MPLCTGPSWTAKQPRSGHLYPFCCPVFPFIHSQHRLCHSLSSLLCSPFCPVLPALATLTPFRSQSTWPIPAQASVKFSFFWNLFCGSAQGWLLTVFSLLRLALVYLKWSALPFCCVTLPVLQLPLLCLLYPPSSLLISSVWAALLADSGVHEM